MGTSKAFVRGKTLATVEGDINSLKTSVSNGKSAVASAITDKGVSTSATASFETMATNIGKISSMKSETRVINHHIEWPNQSNCYRVDVTYSYSPLFLLVHYPNIEQENGCEYFYLPQDIEVKMQIRSPGMSWNGSETYYSLLSGNSAYIFNYRVGNPTHVGEADIPITIISYYQ